MSVRNNRRPLFPVIFIKIVLSILFIGSQCLPIPSSSIEVDTPRYVSEESVILELEAKVAELEERYSGLESLVEMFEEGEDLDLESISAKLADEKLDAESKSRVDASEFGISSVCSTVSGVDYKTTDVISSQQLLPDDLQSCCKQCKKTADCKFFTIDSVQVSSS